MYGRIDVCARLPPCRRGLWPALWLLPTESKYGRWPKSGEIDLMEHVGWGQPGTVHTSVHTASRNHRTRTHSQRTTVIKDAHDKFHVYSLVWRKTGLSICVDGEVVHAFPRDAVKGETWESWPFDQRFFLLINLAVGGKWGGVKGVDDSVFPVSLEVCLKPP